MRTILALIVVVSLRAYSVAAEPTVLTGTVTHVRDGDTIEVGKIPIRLNGVSAPELKQPLGQQSKAFMIDLVNEKQVRCELNGEKTYDRFVGICYRSAEFYRWAACGFGLEASQRTGALFDGAWRQ